MAEIDPRELSECQCEHRCHFERPLKCHPYGVKLLLKWLTVKNNFVICPACIAEGHGNV